MSESGCHDQSDGRFGHRQRRTGTAGDSIYQM